MLVSFASDVTGLLMEGLIRIGGRLGSVINNYRDSFSSSLLGV